jgi:uncharacterized protein (TIGR02217 family)
MFFPIRIAPTPGLGFTGGPEFQTDIKNAQNGREYRNADWLMCRHKYTCPFNNISNDAYLTIKEVFLVVMGRNHSFLHKDWADFEAVNSHFGRGDGVATEFQLYKTSQVGAATYLRKITKPVLAGFTVSINGVVQTDTFTVDQLTGVVTFGTPPAENAALTWSGQFDVQVRFDTDYLPWSLDDRNDAGYVSNGSIDLYEVIDE